MDDELYERAQTVAKRKGVSVPELARQSLEQTVTRELSDRPWMAFAGTLDGETEDSASVDEVVYQRESP